MSPKKSNKKTLVSPKVKATKKIKVAPKTKSQTTKVKSNNVSAIRRKQIEKNTATKLRTTNTSLILESMKRRLNERREPQLKKAQLIIKPQEDEEESEAKRILKKIMEEREDEEGKKEIPSVEKEEAEETDEEEIPIEIPEIEMKQPEEKEDEEDKIEAEKEEKEVDEAKKEEKTEESHRQEMEEKKSPQEDEEEKEMKRFFEPKLQDENTRPMPIIPETQTELVQEKVEEKFNWTRFIVAFVSAVVLATAAGYGFVSLGYSNLFMFVGSLLVLIASTAYFYIVLRNM